MWWYGASKSDQIIRPNGCEIGDIVIKNRYGKVVKLDACHVRIFNSRESTQRMAFLRKRKTLLFKWGSQKESRTIINSQWDFD